MKKYTHYIRTAVASTLVFSLFPLQVFALAPQKITEGKNDRVQEILPLDLKQKKQDLLNRVEEKRASAQFRSDQIVVKYKNDKKPFRVINLPNNIAVLDAVKKYALDDDVEYAELDYIAYADMVPNDPYYSPYQWHMDNSNDSGINTEEAWDISTGEGVIIAIIDTGIAYENYYPYYRAPDLANTCFVQGYDFINNDTHANDDNNHGTHVAGTVAQSTNNNVGVAGVAYDACLMPIKALDRRGSGSYSAIANAIYYAVDNGAQIINMSLGGSYPSSLMEDAVAYAYNNGVTVIAAAGNDNTNTPHYPSSYNDYVISVGATGYNKDRAPYSNYGPDVDIVAPGGDTSEDSNGDGYVDGILQQTFSSYRLSSFSYYFFQGTSMASPHVAGTAALLVANGNATTPDNIRTALESTTQDLGVTGRDDIFGYGLIDAAAALSWGEIFIDTPPEINLTSPVDNSTIYGEVELSANATDESGVIRVDFFVDEMLVGTIETPVGTVREEPYTITWDSTTVGNGPHTITAVAIDTVLQSSSSSLPVTVDNTNQAPIANTGDNQTAIVDTTVTFDASDSTDPDGTIDLYEWDFGDGSTGEGEIVTHTYTTADTYTVTLTVTDNDGSIDTDIAIITVTEEPSEVEVFYDSFEVSEWNGLWAEDRQNDWYRSSGRATDGTYSAEVDGRAVEAALTSTDIDLQGKTNAVVTFDWFIEFSLDTGEYISFDISTDNGSTWTEHSRLRGNVDTENVWHQETIEISDINDLKLRFKGKMSNSREDANVDNVRVMAN